MAVMTKCGNSQVLLDHHEVLGRQGNPAVPAHLVDQVLHRDPHHRGYPTMHTHREWGWEGGREIDFTTVMCMYIHTVCGATFIWACMLDSCTITQYIHISDILVYMAAGASKQNY